MVDRIPEDSTFVARDLLPDIKILPGGSPANNTSSTEVSEALSGKNKTAESSQVDNQTEINRICKELEEAEKMNEQLKSDIKSYEQPQPRTIAENDIPKKRQTDGMLKEYFDRTRAAMHRKWGKFFGLT